MDSNFSVTQAEMDAVKSVRLPEETKREIILRSKQGQKKHEIRKAMGLTEWAVHVTLDEKAREHGKKQSLKYRGISEPEYVARAREKGLDPTTEAKKFAKNRESFFAAAEPTENDRLGTPQTKPVKPNKPEVQEIKVDVTDPVEELLADLAKAKTQGISIGALGPLADELLGDLERRGHVLEYVSGRLRLASMPETRVNNTSVEGMFKANRKKHGFAVITDTHFGGHQAQPWFVREVLEEASRRKYDFVAHVGDHVDGPPAMHKGFEYELGLHKADDQVDFAANTYAFSELPVIGITGNHDGSFFKAAGLDVGRMIQERCEQFTHIGPIQGWIAGPNGDPNFIRLFHPGDGCSYALSYKDQKTAEYLVLENDKVPTGFHFTGHYHKQNQMRGPNGARYFLAPASCATTAFMKAKRLINQAGALFIEFTLDKQGRVDRCTVEDIILPPDAWTKCDYTSHKALKAISRTSNPWK